MNKQPDIKNIKHHYAGTFLLTESGRIIGQKRDDKPDIDNPGKVSTFGGTVEPGETPVMGAWRELTKEETNLVLDINSFKSLFSDVKWRELTQEWEVVHFFVTNISDLQLKKLEIYEGESWVYIDSSTDPDLIESWRPIIARAIEVINS